MKKMLVSFLVFATLTTALIGCAPTVTSLPAATPSPAPTDTPILTVAPILTSTFSPTPSSQPASSTDFKRVTLNEFMPDLIFDFPISFEIPEEYALFTFDDDYDAFYWMPPIEGELARQSGKKPRNTGFFRAKLSINVGYDIQTDAFIGAPNGAEDQSAIQGLEDQGIVLQRVEIKMIGIYPILIMETESPYAETTRIIQYVYIATLVDTNVLLIVYYFALPADPQEDQVIWERFETSMETRQ